MRVCPSCGERNPERARYCMACGSRVALAIPVGDVRKVVTVLFSDVHGSTEMGERLDAESIREIMTRYFGQARQILERHGGTVEKFIGDAVVAVFGIPRVHDDDALRAVRAALEIRDVIQALDAEIRERWGLGLLVRTGVYTGEVVAGDPTTDHTFVVGDTVNTAARLEQAAPPGEILIGDDTRRLVEHAVALEPVEPLKLKGKAEPVPAFLIRGYVLPVDGAASSRDGDTQVRGRDLELQQLDEVFASAVARRTTASVVVEGEAGIGKTALIGAFVHTLGDEAFAARVQIVPPHEGGAETDPLRAMVAKLLGPDSTSTFDQLRSRVAELFSGSERSEVLALGLAHVLGIALPAGGSSTPDEARWAVGEYIRARATARPGVLWFDDVHRAEPWQLALIEWLPHALADAPALVVRSRRPESEDFGDLPAMPTTEPDVRIVLGPIEEKDAADVLADVLAAAPERSIVDVLVGAAGGNPLFLRESAQLLLGDGAIRRDGKTVVATRDLASSRVPVTIRAVLEARLDLFPPEQRAIIDTASVVAGSMPVEALVGMVSPQLSPGVAALVEELVKQEVLRAEPGSVRFRHVLLQEVALDGLTKRRAAELHESYGRWLAGHDDNPLGPEPVGHHLEQAFALRRQLAVISSDDTSLAMDAAEWLVRAGRELISSDPPAASRLLARARALLVDGKVEPGAVSREAGLLAFALGIWDEATDLLAPSAAQPDDRLAQRSLGVALTKRFRDQPGGEEFRRGQSLLETAAAAGDADATASLAGSWRGIDEDKARALYRQAVERDPTEPYALGNLIEYELLSGAATLDEALLQQIGGAVVRRQQQAVAGEELPWAYFDLGKFGLLRGDVDEALSAYAKAVQLSTAAFMIETSDRSLARIEGALPADAGLALARRLLVLGLAARFPASSRRERLVGLATDRGRIAAPVLVLAAGSRGQVPPDIRELLLAALRDVDGTVIADGMARDVGAFADSLGRGDAEQPAINREEDDVDLWEPLRYWTDLLAGGTDPARVRLLGIGGGRVVAFAYRLALALGARVGIVRGSGREAGAFLRDPAWAASMLVDELDADEGSIRRFITTTRSVSSSRSSPMDPAEQRPRSRPHTPTVARVADPRRLSDVLHESSLGVGTRPVLIVLGGAGGMTSTEMEMARPLFVGLAQLCERAGAAVVDGGTDGGVMRLSGEARRGTKGSFPLIGVAPEGTISLPGTSPGAERVAIEPNHTHLFVVPGSAWGDESPWICRVALSIAGAHGVAAVVIGGGAVSLKDVGEAVAAGIRVIAVADSGRTASLLASATEGGTNDIPVRTIAETGLVRGIHGIQDPASVTRAIGTLLAQRDGA